MGEHFDIPELRKTFVIFLMDVSPDTISVQQMKPVAYCESEGYAKEITDFLNKSEAADDPNRTYKYTTLFQ